MVRRARGGRRRPARRAGRKGKSKPFTTGPKTVRATAALAVPDRMLLKLPYYESIKWSGNPVAYYDWNLNSIYDPNRTGTGHQPLGYDQWATFYNRYRVYGVTVRFSATNLADVPVRIGIVGDNSSSGATYLTDQSRFEQPHMKSFILGNANGMNTRSFKMFFSCARIQGSPKVRYNSENQFAAQWNANPIENIVGHIIGQSLDGQTALNVQWDIHMIFHIEAFDRKVLLLSNTAPDLRGPESNQEESDKGPTGPTGPQGDSGLLL